MFVSLSGLCAGGACVAHAHAAELFDISRFFLVLVGMAVLLYAAVLLAVELYAVARRHDRADDARRVRVPDRLTPHLRWDATAGWSGGRVADLSTAATGGAPR